MVPETRHIRSPRYFLRAYGFLLAAVYLSLASQMELLIGPDGLLPAVRFVQVAKGVEWWQAPTVFRWIEPDAAALHGVIGIGLLCSVLIAAGRAERLALAIHFCAYLSLVTAGQRFFTFQWDNLILETTAIAILLPSRRSREEAAPVAVFLFRFLLFRLLFESGISKIRFGDSSWHEWIAMDHYYETAPIPTLAGWWVHQLPHGFHVFEQVMTYVAELLIPFFCFGPALLRRTAFFINLMLQATIVVTANYGSFNYLSALIGLLLLDDRDWAWLASVFRRPVSWKRPSLANRAVAWFAGVQLFMLAAVSDIGFVMPGRLPDSMDRILNAYVRPFRAVNNYHLFADVTLERPTTEIEGTADGVRWEPYAFRHQATRLDWRPEFLAPHHPRVAFQHWFLALGSHPPVAERWFANLLEKVCLDPGRVAPLFVSMPFGTAPPRRLRVTVWDYRMTDPDTLSATGNYWSKTPDGDPIEIPCSVFLSEQWRNRR